MTLKERVKLFCERKNIAISQFEKACGLSNGYFNQVAKRPSISKLSKITDTYPELNDEWLLTGEGDMLRTASAVDSVLSGIKGYSAPFVPTYAAAGRLPEVALDGVTKEQCEMISVPCKCDWVITVRGDSMQPDYPEGALVCIRRVDSSIFMEWGGIYVLDTRGGSLIKVLRKGSTEECVTCHSLNPQYQDFEVRFDDIFGIYKIVMLMIAK